MSDGATPSASATMSKASTPTCGTDGRDAIIREQAMPVTTLERACESTSLSNGHGLASRFVASTREDISKLAQASQPTIAILKAPYHHFIRYRCSRFKLTIEHRWSLLGDRPIPAVSVHESGELFLVLWSIESPAKSVLIGAS